MRRGLDLRSGTPREIYYSLALSITLFQSAENALPCLLELEQEL